MAEGRSSVAVSHIQRSHPPRMRTFARHQDKPLGMTMYGALYIAHIISCDVRQDRHSLIAWQPLWRTVFPLCFSELGSGRLRLHCSLPRLTAEARCPPAQIRLQRNQLPQKNPVRKDTHRFSLTLSCS